MEDKEKSGEQLSKLENEFDWPQEKPNWFICFFKVLATVYFGGFLGKDLIRGEKISNRFLGFVLQVFCLTIESLPIALFISYFLITLPTWLFVLAIVQMALSLFRFVDMTNQAKQFLAKHQEPIKYEEEAAQNCVKAYIYGDGYYANRPTTLIGDFFRWIGNSYFAFLFGKNFMLGNKAERSNFAKLNILNIIVILCFLASVVSCFLITIPTWLFVLAIVAAVSKLVTTFYNSCYRRQKVRRDIFLCNCQGKDKIHGSLHQVIEENRVKVPQQLGTGRMEVYDCDSVIQY